LRRGTAPLDRVVRYFCDEGYSVTLNDGVVWLERGGVKGSVWVVPTDGGLDELIWAVMGATEHSSKLGASYVALPAQLAERVDESHFWTYGIGLLVYEGETVWEELHPRRGVCSGASAAEVGRAPETSASEEVIGELLRRVERLEREVARLGGLGEVMARLEALEMMVVGRGAKLSPSPAEEHRRGGHAPPSIQGGPIADRSPLPSYLRDNPWLEVLAAKR